MAASVVAAAAGDATKPESQNNGAGLAAAGGGAGEASRNEDFVEVPNTEFVALIVGRNGHKIKAIREKTGTFIKTPLRNETPVFKIVGQLKNVAKAKQEILDIVQRLKCHQYRYDDILKNIWPDDEQRITINVRVPFRLVGLVVGFQGSTVKEIQLQSRTHIQTPAHGGEPIFQITGGPKNVFIAKVMMLEFIKSRIGFGIEEIQALLGESVDTSMLELVNSLGVDSAVNWFYNNFISVATPEELRRITLQLAKAKHAPNIAPVAMERDKPLDFEKILQNRNCLEILKGKILGPDLLLLNSKVEQQLKLLLPVAAAKINRTVLPAIPSSCGKPIKSPGAQNNFWEYIATVNNLPAEQVL